MATIIDVLHHIAQDLDFIGTDLKSSDVDCFAPATKFDISIAITDDVEHTEQQFIEMVGAGSTFYFRLKDYNDGKRLAAGLCFVFSHRVPDMSKYIGDIFPSQDNLYLFIHLKFLP